VTDMSFMFARAAEFNGDLSLWNVGRVTDVSYMFSRTVRFNGDLSKVPGTNSWIGCLLNGDSKV
jgi:hypothetical protein